MNVKRRAQCLFIAKFGKIKGIAGRDALHGRNNNRNIELVHDISETELLVAWALQTKSVIKDFFSFLV